MMKIGVLLPHFGRESSAGLVADVARFAEDSGLDSLWVRDHLSFQPHGFEERSTRFMEPFTTITALAAMTSRITFGTAVTVPFRHPLVVSQLYGGISDVAGPGRLIAGIGAGQPRLPFTATGSDYVHRFGRVREFAEILRATFGGAKVSYAGRYYRFEDVIIDPPAGAGTPLWYGGSGRGSIERAVEYADGWLPARCPTSILTARLKALRAADVVAGHSTTVACMPLLSIDGRDASPLPESTIDSLILEARQNEAWEGSYESAEDVHGMLIAGSPERCRSELADLARLGVDHVIVDLRLRHADFMLQLELLTEEVLPGLAEETTNAP